MRAIVSFFLVLFVLVSTAEAQVQYFKIVDEGKTYPWFEKESREKYIDTHLPYLSAKTRAFLLKNQDSPFYSPQKGDIGILIDDLPEQEKILDYVILDVDGNYVLVSDTGVKKQDNISYVITDSGRTHPFFNKLDSRKKYIDKALPNLSEKTRKLVLSRDNKLNYKPHNGDKGILVEDLKPRVLIDKDLVILSIEGNLVLVDDTAVKKVSKKDYDKFVSTISSLGEEVFGFRIGQTTFSEAVKILEQAGAKFDKDLGYKGYAGSSGIPVILVNEYIKIPVIKTLSPISTYLWFVENKLYEISFLWAPKSNFLRDVREYNSINVHSDIIDALMVKYRKEFKMSDTDRESHWRFWLNKKRGIDLISYSDHSDGLKYLDTDLYEVAGKLKAFIDKKIEEENRNKSLMKNTNQL